MFIPKGSQIEFRMHYITTGRPESDQSTLKIYTYDHPPGKILSVGVMSKRGFTIPAGDPDYHLSDTYHFKESAKLYAIQPHMHLRGKSMRFIFQYPDGHQKILLSIPTYDFHWQRQYFFKTPEIIPAGTTVLVEGAYDNSDGNENNPDPSQPVSYGPYGNSEMFTAIFYYTKN